MIFALKIWSLSLHGFKKNEKIHDPKMSRSQPTPAPTSPVPFRWPRRTRARPGPPRTGWTRRPLRPRPGPETVKVFGWLEKSSGPSSGPETWKHFFETCCSWSKGERNGFDMLFNCMQIQRLPLPNVGWSGRWWWCTWFLAVLELVLFGCWGAQQKGLWVGHHSGDTATTSKGSESLSR